MMNIVIYMHIYVCVENCLRELILYLLITYTHTHTQIRIGKLMAVWTKLNSDCLYNYINF